LREAWDYIGVTDQTEAHLSLTPEEEEQGRQGLKQLGLPDDAPFVCLNMRDSGYLERTVPADSADGWQYHNHRDASIQSYLPAAEQMADKGYYVFRTGVAVKEAFKSANPRIIDYAVDGRTDFLDIYLSAKCHFFISDTGGLATVPGIFRRPIAWLNYIPLEQAPTWSSKEIFLLKKLWSIEGRKFLTFREILNSEVRRFGSGEQYARHGIEIVDNTPEEISSLVLEMEQRLAGTWQTTEAEEDLQARFWALFPQRYPNRAFRSRIGTQFLRENQELLD
jgi:putative glycosyltransferase (TIGR04372 family)